jgi:hypothetical protein
MSLVPLLRRLALAAFAAVAVLVLSVPPLASAASTTFLPTGTEQTFVVPAGVTSIHAVAIGGHGGEGASGGPAGFGAVVSADLTVTPNEVLYVEVGGNGASGTEGGAGGFNGGGNGGEGGYTDGGGGGGATDIRTAPRAAGVSLFERLLVAGGGGGSGGDKCGPSPDDIGYGGTAGLTPTAGGASCGGGGQPGTDSAGGAGATGCGEGIDTDGQIAVGGPGEWDHNCFGPGGAGGGGGGGLFGGGGGGSSSAGGGAGAGSSGAGSGATNLTIATDTTASPSVLLTYAGSTSTNTGTGTGSGPNPPPPNVLPAKLCKVPSLVGKSLKAAKKALAKSNCKAGAIKHRPHGPHTVVGQGQKAGKSLRAGTAVSITLGGGGSHAHSHRRS